MTSCSPTPLPVPFPPYCLSASQVYEVNGDLYWDKDERKVICAALTTHCGPPHTKSGSESYWDNWIYSTQLARSTRVRLLMRW